MSSNPVYAPTVKRWEPIAKADLIDWVQARATVWYTVREDFIEKGDQIKFMQTRRKYMESRSVDELLTEILETFPEEEFGNA